MKIGVSIFGSGGRIPSDVFPSYGEGYGKEVIGTAFGFGGNFVQFNPDGSDVIYTIPTDYDWVLLRIIQP